MKKISKSRIEERLKVKTNPYLVETIIKLKKTHPELAKLIAMPRKKQIQMNLDSLDKLAKEGEKIIFPGKILSSGDLTKKLKIIALSASKKAIERIKKSKSEFSTLYEEIKENKKLNDYKLLK